MPRSNLELYVRQSSEIDELQQLYHVFQKFLVSINVHYCSIKFVRVFRQKVYMAPLFERLPEYQFRPEEQYNLFVKTSLGQRSLSARQPFFWDVNGFEQDESCSARIKTYFSKQGLNGGFCVPVVHSFSTKSTAMFMFRQMEKAREQAFALRTSVLYLLNDILRISSNATDFETFKDAPKTAALSRREAEIISWIAMGKSSWETATILGISEHTVNGHIESAVRKLDAKNRTEAVAIALITHQLDLMGRTTH